jgi:hypothetical protein
LPRITEVHKLWYIRKGFGEIVGLREGNWLKERDDCIMKAFITCMHCTSLNIIRVTKTDQATKRMKLGILSTYERIILNES